MIKLEKETVYGWEAVKGFEDYYSISPEGLVYSIRRNKMLSPSIACGYKQYEFNVNGKVTKHLAHRLVAEAFIPNPDNLPCINHKDGNKLNNSVENLEWCTYKENMEHASKHGLLSTIGENNPQSKLNEKDVSYIRSVYKKGSKQFGTVALGKKFGVDHKAIWAIVNGVTWRTT